MHETSLAKKNSIQIFCRWVLFTFRLTMVISQFFSLQDIKLCIQFNQLFYSIYFDWLSISLTFFTPKVRKRVNHNKKIGKFYAKKSQTFFKKTSNFQKDEKRKTHTFLKKTTQEKKTMENKFTRQIR